MQTMIFSGAGKEKIRLSSDKKECAKYYAERMLKGDYISAAFAATFGGLGDGYTLKAYDASVGAGRFKDAETILYRYFDFRIHDFGIEDYPETKGILDEGTKILDENERLISDYLSAKIYTIPSRPSL